MRNALWGEEFQTDQIPLFTSLPGGPDVSNANHHVLESGPGLQADGMYRVGRQRPWCLDQRAASAEVEQGELVETRHRAAQPSNDLESWLPSPIAHYTTRS
jgi:hypothetical protein